MKVSINEKAFSPFSATLTVENEKDRQLLYGFLYLDHFNDNRPDDSLGAVENIMGDLSIADCMDTLQAEIANDSMYDVGGEG